MLPSLAPPRDRRMDITALCEPVTAATTGTSANDAFELEVQAQMQQMSHHSWPLYRVEQDRILDRHERRAASTRFQHLDAAAVAHSSSLSAKAPAFMIDNPLMIAANRLNANAASVSHVLPSMTTSLAPYAPSHIPPLRHLELAPRLSAADDDDDESPIAVLSTVALATREAPSAQRPPPAPTSRPRKAAATSSSTTAASSKKRSRRMSNSERGKLYRSRRKTYVESLESDVQELAQEVQGLQVYGRILQEMALHTPASNGGSYSRVVTEYFSVFAAGIPVNPDEPTDLALVRPTPRQSVFVSTLMAPDMAFCGTGGPKRLLHNWQCFSLYHASLSYSLKQLQVILPEPTAVVSADAVLRVRLTRATVEKMFPHVLWNEPLVQKLIGLEVTYNVGNRFYFSETGKIARYESHVDFLSTFMAALGSLQDAIEVAGPITERQQREQHDTPSVAVGQEAQGQGQASSETETDSDATDTHNATVNKRWQRESRVATAATAAAIISSATFTCTRTILDGRTAMPHRAATHLHTAAAVVPTVGASSTGDSLRLKKERRNERDRQRSLLKRESLKDMKALVEELEATKRRLLADQAAAATAPQNQWCPPDPQQLSPLSPARLSSDPLPAQSPRTHRTPTTRVDAVSPTKSVERDDFVRVTEQIERLRVENAALAHNLRERDLFNSAMQHLLLDFQRESESAAHRRELIGFSPLTRDEVQAFVTLALRQCRNARFANAASSAAAVGSVFGWSDFRVRTGATITFSVKKTLLRTRPRALLESIWSIATDSARIASLLPPGLECDLRVLQRVSDNVLIIDRRTYSSSSGGGGLAKGVALRTVFMVFRVRDDDGSELLVMKTLDSPLAKKLLLPDEVWCDIFYWMRFEAVAAPPSSGGLRLDTSAAATSPPPIEDTRTEFGGVLTYVREDFAVSWLAELLFLAIRWETIAVRPVLLTWS